MPILRNPKPDEPLQQGDILKGVKLLATGNDWDRGGGSPEELSGVLSLLISRPCVIANKLQIVVAAIEGRTENIPAEVRTFEEAKAFLQDIRDGLSRPDRFYLGQIPGESSGRYYAKFDSLHTIALPEPPNSRRLVSSHRIAVLAEEFIRDLHLRIFSTFANLGFDDIGWYSDGDLQWLIDKGEHALQSAQTSLAETKATKSGLEAAGSMKANQAQGIEKQITNHTRQVERLEIEVGQLKAELARRHAH